MALNVQAMDQTANKLSDEPRTLILQTATQTQTVYAARSAVVEPTRRHKLCHSLADQSKRIEAPWVVVWFGSVWVGA